MAIRIGGPGADNLVGTALADRMRGNGGNDTLGGRAGNDDMTGGSGNDRMFGELGNDRMLGETGNDVVNGGGGGDSLYGGQGVDNVLGGDGGDYVTGAGPNGANDFAADTARGGNGNDTVDGFDASSDTLFGDAGNDSIFVNNDVANGGSGNDFISSSRDGGRVTGGAGADTFSHFTTFDNNNSQELVVTDFTTADNFGWSVSNASFGIFYDAQVLFDHLDSNDSNTLSASDGFTTTSDGVGVGVVDTGANLVLFVNEDSVTFNNLGIISGADWA